MPKNVMCKNCNNLINGWCEKKFDSPVPNMKRDCQYFRQKTNADRIRAMSDEELADWIARTQISNVAEAIEVIGVAWEQPDNLKDGVKKECLEWLQQPAEEN